MNLRTRQGIAVGLTATAAYVIGRATEPAAAQTMAFATLATAELVLVFSIRSGISPAWRVPRNPLLFASVLVSFLLLVLSIYLPPLRDAFGTERWASPQPPSWPSWPWSHRA